MKILIHSFFIRTIILEPRVRRRGHLERPKDNDILSDIFIDFAAGVGMAVCEKYPLIATFMTVAGLISITASLGIGIFGSDRDRRDLWESMPSPKRSGTVGLGYFIARMTGYAS